jgi:tripartite motif-containing protein 71
MNGRLLLAVACAALAVGGASASASDPLALDQPLGIDVAPNGSLLVVEFGSRRLVRVSPATGRVAQIATFVKPWGVARAPSGSIYVSDGGRLRRVVAGHVPVTVATVGSAFEIGPVAVTPNGDVVYATAVALYRLRGGKGSPKQVSPGTALNSSHGIAVTADGSLLVSDSNNNRILRVKGAMVTTFATLGHPRGIDVAPNGTVYVAAADAHRIARFSASGKRLGFVGPRFDDPYALSVAKDGTVYALDLGMIGIIRRIAPNGVASVLAAP